MADLPDIRWNEPRDRDRILAFIGAMGFTPRDATTWDGLAMQAVCAWRGSQLVGILPIEPRPFQIAAGATVDAAHLTCVAVHPDERGGGVGSAMQRFLADHPPAGTKLFTVYREEPESPGYRWYGKNGFTRAMHIVSWTMPLDRKADVAQRQAAEIVPRPDEWQRVRAHGGVVDQMKRPLDVWAAVHPYRGRYEFELITGRGGYAVVGVGSLHSAGPRLDILDLIAADADAARSVLQGCIDHARGRGIVTIRVALAEHDPHAIVAAGLGMTAGWNFDLLVRVIDPTLILDTSNWRYASIDFA